jgi:hypothetical protein
VNTHEQVSFFGWLERNNLIAADSSPAVSDSLGLFGVKDNRRDSAIKHNEIVAKAMHLDKSTCGHLGVIGLVQPPRPVF